MPAPVTRKPRKDKPTGFALFKTANQLGVSTERIVTTLRERGFTLEGRLAGNDPNAKLTTEMRDALLDVFAEDAATRGRVAHLRADMEAERKAIEDDRRHEEERATPAARSEPVVEAALEPEPAPEPEPEPEPEAMPEPEIAEAAPAPVVEAEEAPAESDRAPVAEAETPAPVVDEAPGAEAAVADAPAEGAPVELGADEEGEVVVDAEGHVIRANRYQLTGTTVLNKIDVSDMGAGGRRRRKRKGDEPAAVEGETPAATTEAGAATTEGARRARGGKKTTGRRAAVDRAEVEANLQQTLTQLGQGTGRKRQKARRARRDERTAEREAEQERMASEAGTLRVLEFLSTGELANAMGVGVSEVISKGFGLGIMVSINQRLDADTITLLADEFGYEVEFVSSEEEDLAVIEDDAPEDMMPRAPVVTIMGHVDHGKTSLLDYIRNAAVVAGESGGITQHIGAYEVKLDDGREITFLDTPGHEAFTAMRARGAQVTDLVVIVVAADDQVMPQTVEAINHARAAGVPIVVAMNKMDRAEANPDKIMAGLSELGVLVEQYGGQVQAEPISAKTGLGVPQLLEKVLVEAEVLDLKANPARDAIGTVIESRLDKGRGVVATVLVQTGTLRVGDAFVAGSQSGRVRAMFDERDQRAESAGPSQPVQILGFASAPDVGDRLVVMEDERAAREVAGRRIQLHREQALRARRHISLDELSRLMALGDLKELNLVVKGDVAGSVEALSDSLLKITNDEVSVNIVHSGAGAITESDVMLAAASDAIIIGFNVRPMPAARAVAEREEIDIRHYSVIYDAIEEVRDALEGLLSPEETEKVTGTVEVRETFKVPRVGTIAGSYVLDGKIRRNDRVRLIRDGVVVYTGSIDSLKRFKEDAKEVAAGYECGLSIGGFNDIKVGDHIEAFEVVETKRQLTV